MSETRRLYNVSMTVDIMVVAESEAQACEMAEEEFRDPSGGTLDFDDIDATPVESLDGIGVGWSPESIPFGDNPGNLRVKDFIIPDTPPKRVVKKTPALETAQPDTVPSSGRELLTDRQLAVASGKLAEIEIALPRSGESHETQIRRVDAILQAIHEARTTTHE